MQPRRTAGLVLSIAWSLVGLAALPATGSARGLAGELGPGVDVSRQDETGKVGFIGTEPGAAIDAGLPASASAREVAKGFVEDHARAFGLADSGAALRAIGIAPAAGDGKAVRLQQLQDGLPVLAGELVVDLDADRDVLAVLGETSPSPNVDAAPDVRGGEATSAAVATVARAHELGGSQLTATAPRLHVYDPRLLGAPDATNQPRAAWVLEVESVEDASVPEPIRELVVVDAATGVVALHFDQVAHAKSRSVCDANNTPNQYPCASPVWTEATQPGGVDADVVAAFDYAGDTYDFFFDRFGRDSLDGAGMPLISTVDYCDPLEPCPYANAFWDGSQMVYGDGFAAADDVVGHELSHGFTEFTSHLFYYAQSGAINESMSDVFGEFIDLTNGAGTDTAGVRWELGEDIPGLGAIRDMSSPPTFNDPDRMTSALFTADPNEADAGGVHTNSGVNNKAAFLIADGGTFNGQAITGLGIPKAAAIYHEVETALLVSGSDYADLGNALNQACTNLLGETPVGGGSPIGAADCTEVSQAVLATEMATNPPNAPTKTAPTCTSGSPVDVFTDDLENPASGDWTTSGGAWYYPQNPNPYPGFDATYATSGDTNFWGDDPDDATDSAIRMASPIAVPANAFMRFNHAFGFDDTNSPSRAYDGGVVEYSTNAGATWLDAGALFDSGTGYNGEIYSGAAGNALSGRAAFVRESNGYGASRLNLASLAGQNVMFRFRIGGDEVVGDYGWFIDDVRLYTCPASTPSLSIADVSHSEGDAGTSSASLTVTLSAAAAGQVTVDYATSDGTATQPGDYSQTSGTLMFAPGDTTETIAVNVNGDADVEPDETVSVDLSAASGASIADGHGVLTIANDDVVPPTPSLSIADATVAEGNSGAANAALVVSLTPTSAGPVSVEYATADGTATAPADYGTSSGTLTFTPGDGTETINVPVNGDAADEPDETVLVNLSSATGGASIADAQGVVTIVDDDASGGGGGGGGGGPDATAPDTRIDSGPRRRTKKRRARFTFSATEAGPRFECSLDGARFAPCASPKTVRVRRGRHKFAVRARDAAGNVDTTPAGRSWKVKRKRRR